MLTSTQWAKIPWLPEHEISREGEVRRSVSRRNWRAGRKAQSFEDRKGYQRVTLNGRNYGVHRLVCEAFNGPPPFPGALARHLNDDKSDNRPENLAWGTQADNYRDAVRNGTVGRPPRKFCREHAKELRAKGWTFRKIAAQFGVSHVAIVLALRAATEN